MELKRLGTMHPSWLLDGRYEIHFEYNHGHFLRMVDRETKVKVLDWEKCESHKEGDVWVHTEVFKDAPQEHLYVPARDGEPERGLHHVTI